MSNTTDDSWTPAVELDLLTASTAAFQEVQDRFDEWAKTQAQPGPFPLRNGWHDITPQIAEDLLLRNGRNRKVSLTTVKKYYRAMLNGQWMPTGQPILVNKAGKTEDCQHRAWASYLGRVTFHSHVVADVPVNPELFAYIDDSKPRSASDALYTSGNNGLSATIAATVKLAWRYDAGAITVMAKQPRIREASIPEILDYTRTHPGLREAAHLLVSSYGKAVKIIGDKAAATLFLWRATEEHGPQVVNSFMVSIGLGANLDVDSPVLGFRERMRNAGLTPDDDVTRELRLALLIKAFNLYVAGGKVGRAGLHVKDNEKFPKIDPAQPAVAVAAE
jgi:hypothetical protein